MTERSQSLGCFITQIKCFHVPPHSHVSASDHVDSCRLAPTTRESWAWSSLLLSRDQAFLSGFWAGLGWANKRENSTFICMKLLEGGKISSLWQIKATYYLDAGGENSPRIFGQVLFLMFDLKIIGDKVCYLLAQVLFSSQNSCEP